MNRLIKFSLQILGIFIIAFNVNTFEAKASDNSISASWTINTNQNIENQDGSITADLSKNLISLNSITMSFEENNFLTSEIAGAQVIKEGIKQHKSQIIVYICTKDSEYFELFDRMWAVAFSETDSPVEGDYMYWQMASMSTALDGKIRMAGKTKYYYYTFTVSVKYYTTTEQETELTSAIEIVNDNFNFSGTESDYQKIKTIYDYMCQNIKYSYSTDNIKFSAYSAVMNGEAVCQGYASLFYRLAKMQGISSRIIAGLGTSDVVYHGWNIVKIGELYYNVDTTWDAVNFKNSNPYEYFLKGDVFEDHTRNDEYKTAAFYIKYPMSANDYSISGKQVQSAATIDAEFVQKKAVIKKLTKKSIKIYKIGNATGYIINYSTKKNFIIKKKIVTKKLTYRLKKLKKKKRYYFRVRAYRQSGTGKKYTKWSKRKSIKM